MNFQNQKISNLNLGFEAKNFYSILGLYVLSLGSLIGGFSLYLLLEATGTVDPVLIVWNGQGFYWFLILFCSALFLLFIPVEFLSTFKLYNSNFKDLISNILYVILFSLTSLVLFQFILSTETQILSDIKSIARAVSFSGFISIPLVLFAQHSLMETLPFTEKFSYSFTLIFWIISAQIFL